MCSPIAVLSAVPPGPSAHHALNEAEGSALAGACSLNSDETLKEVLSFKDIDMFH